MEGNEEQSFGEKVMDAVSQQSATKEVVIRFPRRTFKKFDKWAFDNGADCYWLAIEKLMDSYDNQQFIEAQVRMLSERDDFLLGEISLLHEEINKLKGTPAAPKKRTFGKQETVKENE